MKHDKSAPTSPLVLIEFPQNDEWFKKSTKLVDDVILQPHHINEEQLPIQSHGECCSPVHDILNASHVSNVVGENSQVIDLDVTTPTPPYMSPTISSHEISPQNSESPLGSPTHISASCLPVISPSSSHDISQQLFVQLPFTAKVPDQPAPTKAQQHQMITRHKLRNDPSLASRMVLLTSSSLIKPKTLRTAMKYEI